MAIFSPVQGAWIFYIIYTIFTHRISGAKDVCNEQCDCYSWSSMNTTQRYDRFTVNCTRMRYGLGEGFMVPKPLPFNATDFLVKGYLLSILSIRSFDTERLGPQLLKLELRKCFIRYISYDTFSSNTLQSVRDVDLTSNMIEELHENTFSYLFNVKTISVANNYIQKVGKHAIRNLDDVILINISHNWLKELHPDAFYKVPSLEILDLSYNWLESLPWQSMSKLSSLKVLVLTGNYWNCSCSMSGIIRMNRSLLVGTQAACRLPKSLNGTLLEDLNSDTFSHCFNPEQYFQSSEIITLLCIILSCLYIHDKNDDWRYVGDIMYNINDELDRFGTVFRGQRVTDGKKAAIKKVRNHLWLDICKELKILLHLSEKARPHPNIIQYICAEPDGDYMYLVLELCEGDLMTAVMEGISGFENIIDPKNYFLQLTAGMCFLHEHGIEHRDIKPQNILWKRTVTGVALVIADFDLGHFSQERSSHRVMYGTLGWSAPEMCQVGQQRFNAVDVFSLGCVFYFMLTREHPFGPITNLAECQENINSPEYTASLDALYGHYSEHMHLALMAEDLISRMICANGSERIKDNQIKKHPFLLNRVDMANFLTAIGACMKEKKDQKFTRFQEMLEENASMVFDGKWWEKLHASVQDDLNQYKKKGNTAICNLLWAIRSKIAHFHEIGRIDVREMYLGNKFGVAEYYMRIFPNLVSYTYSTLLMSEIDETSALGENLHQYIMQ